MSDTRSTLRIAVVIPCYKVTQHVLDVISAIGPACSRIYAVDDCCPAGSGDLITAQCHDPRVRVLRNPSNLGVGGAVKLGYAAALADGMDIVVKIDGDGQMDPALLPQFVQPILDGEADYTKGNRFLELEALKAMPTLRLVGNSLLSFLTKFSSGYWDIFDPTNGYTAIHREALRRLPLAKISNRYFFESDLLFRLNLVRAVVVDIPMAAKYADEVSNLRISAVVGEFFCKHLRNFGKRIVYNYYLRDMSLASIELPLGILLLLFGLLFGSVEWLASLRSGVPATTGTVMLSVLPILMGLQFNLSFLAFDIAAMPRRPLSRLHRDHA
jgi:glycosyltransferase involved in cell wall biosynthesis